MSTRHLQRVIGQRGKTTLELERENFEKSQAVAINKAINNQETPVKEKHLRNTILGTFTDHGGNLFWTITIRLPLQANPIVAWKFCQVLHKLLREGHRNVLKDSLRYRSNIIEIGKLWGHLKEGYGRLIAAYCTLVVQKMDFQKKYPEIPGNLLMDDEKYAHVCGSDVNNYFEISVDMLDYMDEILHLQEVVFGSLDKSRANSMTNSGQCRLAPLILCIQDSCQLYDYIVKSLFKLHSSLPQDTLTGHRDRFLSAYKRLKQFYYSSSNLQYFKNLVQVPALPEEPPNFLIASDFSKHVKPVAVVPEPEPDPEPEPVEVVDLVDTAVPAPQETLRPSHFSFNGGPTVPEVDERDLLIERLTKEVRALRAELERVKAEDQKTISALKEEISKLEKILSELRVSADKALKENNSLQKQLAEAKILAGASVKLTEAEKQAKQSEEKFKKMKEVYNKLRDEHVTLLRTHGEVVKQQSSDKKFLEEKEQMIKDAKMDMQRMEEERRVIQNSLQQTADEITNQLATTTTKNTDLEKRKQELESQVHFLEKTRTSLEEQLQSTEEQKTNLESHLKQTLEEKEAEHDDLTNQIATLQGEISQMREEKQLMEQQLKSQLTNLQSELNESQESRRSLEEQLKQTIAELQQQLDQVTADYESTEKQLNSDIGNIHKKLIETSIREGKAFIQDALDQFENPSFTTVKCTAEFLLMRAEPVLASLHNLQKSFKIYGLDRTGLETFVECITSFAHHMGDCIIHGIATSHSTAQIESGEELGAICRSTGESGLEVLKALQKGDNIQTEIDKAVHDVEELMRLSEALVPKADDIKAEDMGDMVDNEMQSTTRAIEQAAARIEEMLHRTREDNTGIQLEVNERILDACTDLMKAVRILVEKSRDLQKEIIAQGRGTSSVTEFYKKNHRWTEGLLSAAKAVGWAATTLMESADKVMKGEGKLEELIVCSQEIAASTAQLVVSSRVKAQKGSKCMQKVSEASKEVSSATGKVVASVKTGSQIIEEQTLMDFSKLPLMQTKMQEMQLQVHVLELEKELEQERYKLGEIRKRHYQLAGDTEGYELHQDRDCFPWDYAPLM
ncbi:hypothetical protein CHS0354_026598 [Potamilus streckersoni]|uniref:Huntingtin interacting protein 1 n=1 Tax=Potamilus streckersoni TaxID=2493646 RepID=A0AAE0SUD0_9BIVA|nr:hypothetical protein CHS0354_026598 [Potamilus streckersoni]